MDLKAQFARLTREQFEFRRFGHGCDQVDLRPNSDWLPEE